MSVGYRDERDNETPDYRNPSPSVVRTVYPDPFPCQRCGVLWVPHADGMGLVPACDCHARRCEPQSR